MARAKNPRAELFNDCVKQAKDHAGGQRGWDLIGVNFQHALVATQILRRQHQFRNMFSPEVMAEVSEELYTMLIETFPTENY